MNIHWRRLAAPLKCAALCTCGLIPMGGPALPFQPGALDQPSDNASGGAALQTGTAPAPPAAAQSAAETREQEVARLRLEHALEEPAEDTWLAGDEAVAKVQADLAVDGGRTPRADLLAAYARTRASIGRFDLSAVAYGMFLKEFGLGHPYSDEMVSRTVEQVPPIRTDEYVIVHAKSGPVFVARWRGQRVPPADVVEKAIELAMQDAQGHPNSSRAASSLDRVGWLRRWQDRWDDSNAAFHSAALAAPATPESANALWHLADNQTWQEYWSEASATLAEFARQYPQDPRAVAANARLGMMPQK